MRGLGRHKIFNLIYEESKNMKRTVDTRGKIKIKGQWYEEEEEMIMIEWYTYMYEKYLLT